MLCKGTFSKCNSLGTDAEPGIYGIIRMYALLRESSAAPQASSILLAAGVFSIALASFSMFQQRNLKRLIAFSSVEHMGLLLIGIGIGTPLALFWALFYMLVHVLVKETLLFSAGILHRQYRSNMREDMRDVFKLQPRAAWGLILGSIAIVGMPPFPLFPAKFFYPAGKCGSFSLPDPCSVAHAYPCIRILCKLSLESFFKSDRRGRKRKRQTHTQNSCRDRRS
ncbi:proton-conducting transporter transmembrane domain-containing protein [Methanosarcina horonobensis]|uniref:proton-conducting transporter transmembrane domain-containing protein n=1 Tax=Methanosarcina horonobensis TaxID=418008 RepID=UPI000AE0BFFB|nr:proton-conducting transporter membrane subunit [Methanosarcina horonobensis]